MNINTLIHHDKFSLLTNEPQPHLQTNGIFTCDLLSHVMGNAKEGQILVTVLHNINVLGVASLLDLSAVVFTHNPEVDNAVIAKANDLEIPLFKTSLTSTETVLLLSELGA